jgi:hypothetical protein
MKNEFTKRNLNSGNRIHKDFLNNGRCLLDYDLPSINFKKKYAKIIMTLEIKAGEPAVDLHYKNGRNQVKPVFDFMDNTSQSYQDSVENVLTVLKEGILDQYNVAWNHERVLGTMEQNHYRSPAKWYFE